MPELIPPASPVGALAPAAEWDHVESLAAVSPSDEQHNVFVHVCGRWAAAEGDRAALVVRDEQGLSTTWTYRDLDERSARLAGFLARAFGVRAGDRVAGLLDRSAAPWLVACAVWRLGAVYVPLHVGFGAAALSQRLRVSQAKVLVAEGRLGAVVSGALPLVGHDISVLTHGPGADGSATVAVDEALSDAPRWEAARVSPQDVAVLMFTSGASGPPKACTIPHAGWLATVPFITHVLAATPGDRMLCTSDPGWSYGLITMTAALLALGVPVVVQTGRFDADRILDAVDADGVTLLSGAPTAFRALLDRLQERASPSTLRTSTCGGEPLDAETSNAWKRMTGSVLRDGYGLTELGMVLADDGSGDGRLRAVPGWKVRLLTGDRDRGPLTGSLVVRRPRYQLSSGYLDDSAQWHSRWTDDGWFVTEDLFRQDADGSLTYIGRVDDVIVSSGYNISPAEVEAAIRRHPHVQDVAAVPAPDGRGGVVVKAVVQTRPGTDVTGHLTQEIQDLVRESVGRHAYPRLVEYAEELPWTESGKLRRRDLRATPGGSPAQGSRGGRSWDA